MRLGQRRTACCQRKQFEADDGRHNDAQSTVDSNQPRGVLALLHVCGDDRHVHRRVHARPVELVVVEHKGLEVESREVHRRRDVDDRRAPRLAAFCDADQVLVEDRKHRERVEGEALVSVGAA